MSPVTKLPTVGIPITLSLGGKGRAAQRNEVYFDLGSSVFTDSIWQDRQVFDHPVFPAVGFVEIIVAAIREVCGSKPFWLRILVSSYL